LSDNGDGLTISRIDMPIRAGSSYLVRIAGYSDTTIGTGHLLITESANCPGDFNNSGSVSVQDIFDFLSAYFAGCP